VIHQLDLALRKRMSATMAAAAAAAADSAGLDDEAAATANTAVAKLRAAWGQVSVWCWETVVDPTSRLHLTGLGASWQALNAERRLIMDSLRSLAAVLSKAAAAAASSGAATGAEAAAAADVCGDRARQCELEFELLCDALVDRAQRLRPAAGPCLTIDKG
jgi:hypothetical protein